MTKTFVSLSLNRAQLIIIQEIVSWGVKHPDIRDDVIVENFWQPTLGSPVCVVRRRVLLPNLGSFCSHLLDPSQHDPFQALDEGLYVLNEAIMHRQWPPQTPWYGLNVCFSSLSLLLEETEQANCWVYHQILAENFLIWQKAKHVWLKGMLEFVQKLCIAAFLLAFHTLWLKLILSHLVWKMILCTTCLIWSSWLEKNSQIIKLCRKHEFPWLFVTINSNQQVI